MKKYIWIAVLILLVGLSLYFLGATSKEKVVVRSFEDCEKAGFPVMESYPRQCKASEITFVENIGNELEKTDLIVATNPRPNQVVTSPITIEGKARGFWFFEGSFPAMVVDENGKELGVVPVQAKGEWMTEDFVNFEAKLPFESTTSQNGTLILLKDNPSGLTENDDALIIPIKFY